MAWCRPFCTAATTATTCRWAPARVAAGRGRSAAAGQRRTVRRVAGEFARRTGATAGGMRGRHGGRGDTPHHAAAAGRGTGAGRGAGHGRMVDAHQ
ncbi:hypothetical protein G6F23_015181 [Rhizopus arrhizus]|nr:hypothetical protein G6F23_015181 [Rhizopus arrhizus]